MTTSVTSTALPSGLVELKRAHRRTWASGSYATVAERLVDDVPPRHLLERVSIEPGMDVLDIAAGTGNVAIRAAQLGARVTALDLTPELFERGRERAAEAGVEVEWVEGDAEDLPFEDGRFDRVLSTFGIQFAPRHEVAAREAVRVTRPGGTIGLINWTPQGHIGRVLKAAGSRLPKLPVFASPPPLWGDEAHMRELFVPTGVELEFERATNPFVGFASPEEWVEFMETNYGPLLTARAKLASDGGWDELRDELVALTRSLDQGRAGALRVESEYLLTLGRVAAAYTHRARVEDAAGGKE
jgi:SAM-dependent methyltransferase